MNYWTERAELPARRLLGWIGMGASKFHDWKRRYGKVNEYNAEVPLDWWLEDWEKQAIVDYHDRHPLEGDRRLTFMMLDAEAPNRRKAGRRRDRWRQGALVRPGNVQPGTLGCSLCELS